MDSSINKYDNDEPILSINTDKKYTLFPITQSDKPFWDAYKAQQASFWTAEEIQLEKDTADWSKLTLNEQHFIKMVLAFFAGSYGIVSENLATRFQAEIQNPVIGLAYGFQNMIEGIHSEVYSLLIDTYIKDPSEKSKLFNGISEYDCIRKKADWAKKWIGSGDRFATRLVAFACVEGIFFAGSFCAIFWMKRRGLMPGLCYSNELISRDELQHRDFAGLIYRNLKHKLSTETIQQIIAEAVVIEKEFITEALPCHLIGMNSKLMSQYIEFTADNLCLILGTPKIYGSSNPFDFMNMINMEGKTNFFEKKVGEYSKAGVGVDREKMVFKTDIEDF
jgi:ribonucleoside-diphosphate reductase beta chain